MDRYAFEVARDKKVPDVAERQKAIERAELPTESPTEQVTAERGSQHRAGDLTGTSAQTQKDIDALLFEQNRLQKQLATIQPTAVKNYILNAPLLDFMAPTLKVSRFSPRRARCDDANFARCRRWTAAPRVI